MKIKPETISPASREAAAWLIMAAAAIALVWLIRRQLAGIWSSVSKPYNEAVESIATPIFEWWYDSNMPSDDEMLSGLFAKFNLTAAESLTWRRAYWEWKSGRWTTDKYLATVNPIMDQAQTR